MQKLPENMNKDEYELTKWSTMVLHVRYGIHVSYRPTITQMCLIRSVSTRSSVSSEAATLMDVEEDYKIINDMKRALLRNWKDNQKTWKSTGNIKVPTLAMGNESNAYDQSVHEKN